MGNWLCTKIYARSEGLTCCFRNWNSAGRDRLLHGYALSFKMVFESWRLDDRNWVIDQSKFDHITRWLHDNFDHTVCVAEDDPELASLQKLHDQGLLDIRVMPAVGTEKFAEYLFRYVQTWLIAEQMTDRVLIRTVECMEHENNSGLFVE